MTNGEGQGPRARIGAAVLGGRRAAGVFGADLAALLAPVGRWLGRAAREEVDAARLAPWLAIGFGTGILFYFAAPAEPSPLAPVVALALFGLVAWYCHERPLAFVVAVALVSVAAGFGAACLRAALIAHPVLTQPTGTVSVTGFVEARDATERSDRVVLRVTGASGRNAGRVPERVRVALRHGWAPEVGSHVEVLARLRPLVGPVRPGGYDFARDGYFAGLGATGFVLGRAKETPAPASVPWDIQARASVESMRRALADRIRTVLPGDSGAIAAALVTGIRDHMPADVNETMRIAGLYHLLAISGMHMALVAGTLFILIRGGLALIPGFALRYPIKKWAAVAAFAGVAFYLVLSGAKVATQRSFIMIAIVLVGVLMDRPALTIRTLAVAAFGVLLLHPEALINPSFQMSFAATLALVALFERYARSLAAAPPARSNTAIRISARIWRWLLFAVMTTVVAGLATTVYVAFHFHRIAPYSVLANVPAMPLVSLVVMPAGIISVVLMPFGYDSLGWKLMGQGIDLVLAVARFVADLPGASGRIAAFGSGQLLLATAGLLVLAIPASRLRFAGLALFALAFVLGANTPRPDVLVDVEARAVGVRGADGKLTILDARRSRFSAESWLIADADLRPVDEGLASGFNCDDDGCVARLGDGSLVAVAREHAAFAEDCSRTALVVTQLRAPANCAAATIDRDVLATTGALALFRAGKTWRVEAARSPLADRPWYGRARQPDADALTRLAGGAVSMVTAGAADDAVDLEQEVPEAD